MKLYPRPERGDHSLPALYPTHPHSIPSFLGGGGVAPTWTKASCRHSHPQSVHALWPVKLEKRSHGELPNIAASAYQDVHVWSAVLA